MLGPKDLVVNLNTGLSEESLTRVENKDSIFESYQIDEMDGFVDLEIDKSTKEKGEISKSRDLAKTEDTSCGVIDKFDLKKEKEVERWHIELEEIMDNETIECLLEMIKEYS
ncbi:hypothetical protein F8M41_025869 [Gigaspora margarita]|uniref:Uncharacterized protein n=1 Tax=Gigaspora margarita TaxID=4874 RepID=A0A8H4ABF9_GIGMA|nr:hypothetical protein F8M41_025869 [Gigaspora margarita]